MNSAEGRVHCSAGSDTAILYSALPYCGTARLEFRYMLLDPTPRVSVVMPAWNRVGSIRMAVESVLRQTFTDFELLVVDDGSTDGTMDALSDVTDPRLRCLANPRNMGASAARNTGIHAARGEWVAFQDSDDEWLPRKLELQMARLAGAGAEVVACYTGMAIVGLPEGDRDRRTTLRYIPGPKELQVEGTLREALLARSFISTQMLMARRTALLDIGGFDVVLPALVDWDCVIRLSDLGTFAFVDAPLVLQYFSDNSITHSNTKRLQARILILKKHRAALSAYPQVLAGHHVAIAGEQRRLGNITGARVSLAAARRLCPGSVGVWLRSIWLVGMAVMQDGRRRKGS